MKIDLVFKNPGITGRSKKMIIDLMTPLWGGIVAGIVLAVILGLFRFMAISVEKKAIEKKFLDLVSELESLQKNHKNEITSIKETSLEIIKNNFIEYHKAMKEILEKYHRLVPPARLALLEALNNEKDKTS